MLDVLNYVDQRAANIINRVNQIKAETGDVPSLAILTSRINSDANRSYIKSKCAFAEKVGMKCSVLYAEDYESETRLKIELRTFDGVIVQFPFKDLTFEQLQQYIDKLIPATKDVDGLGSGKLFKPCTPLGIYNYLNHSIFDIQGELNAYFAEHEGPIHVHVIGYGGLVGKPMVELLLNDRRYTVSVSRSKTNDSTLTRLHDASDVIVCATPVHNLIGREMYDSSKVYVDCGCNVVDGKLLGNVSRDVYGTGLSMITPVPNGVGRMTVLSLFENVLEAYDKYHIHYRDQDYASKDNANLDKDFVMKLIKGEH